ncbi:YkgJ family cysteine cluster protein [Persephonella sp.]|uniref:YkgJ family cysteine cluster protein n=1 Tax=Persephonella sp. TaxID=2060922 RepID=UPI00261F9A49|nr:YkgJ family cysteine cluster protein [Persephonella sp.]
MEKLENLILAAAGIYRQPELVDEIITLQEELNQQIDKQINKQKGLDCQKGCSYCCYGWNVQMTIPEMLMIIKDLNSFPPGKRRRIADRIYEFSNQTDYEGVACPLLEDNLCLVYESRPFICRTYSSYDVSLCENRKKFVFPPFVEEIIKNVVLPFEENIEEPFRTLFETKVPISNIKFDYYRDLFYLNLANTIKIVPIHEKIEIIPLEFAKKYLQT